jgi:hypothetical protein
VCIWKHAGPVSEQALRLVEIPHPHLWRMCGAACALSNPALAWRCCRRASGMTKQRAEQIAMTHFRSNGLTDNTPVATLSVQLGIVLPCLRVG